MRGVTAADFEKLIYRNGFDSKYQERVDYLRKESKINTLRKREECTSIAKSIYSSRLDTSPLFILGHWRSGTTLLHYILAQDARFGFVTRHHAFNPYSALPPLRDWIYGATSRGVDNVIIDVGAPAEDEFPIAARSLSSPYIGFVFPRHANYYDRFITLREVTSEELSRWTRALEWTLKKATYFFPSRRLLLKSPPHTGRIRTLLKLFPDAKFIHIHRNPAEVIRSIYALNSTFSPANYLENPTGDDIIETIIRRYNMIFDAYYEDIALIPRDRLISIGLDEFLSDPIHSLNKIYETLRLPPFAECEKQVRSYLAMIFSYNKTNHPDVPAIMRREIFRRIAKNVDRLGYTL